MATHSSILAGRTHGKLQFMESQAVRHSLATQQEQWFIIAYGLCVQFISVAQLFLTLCDPLNLSTTGLPVHHQLPESTQTHVHWVGDAIQPSHPLLSPSPSLNLSQHQGLF